MSGSAELVAFSILLASLREEIGETTHGESTLEDTESSMGDTITGLL